MKVVKTTFDAKSIERFAEMSGDYNPIHLDSVKARRMMFGSCIVPGIQVLFWALNAFMSRSFPVLEKLKVEFKRPIRLDEEVEAEKLENYILISSRGQLVMLIQVVWSRPETINVRLLRGFPMKGVPLLHDINTIKESRGSILLYHGKTTPKALFPGFPCRLRNAQIAELLGISRLVGMYCPGMNSLFTEVEITRHPTSDAPRLSYTVTEADPRMNRVLIDIEGPTFVGTLTTFLRPKPVEQATAIELQSKVKRNEFSKQSALVIGGSRGLGEVATKLLALGGAKVHFTYNTGKEDAHRVANELEGVTFSQYNAYEDSWVTTSATHLYFFASPSIFVGALEFSYKLFEKFTGMYVDALHNIIKNEAKLVGIFYPSTITLDNPVPTMTEYTAAKGAGEASLLTKPAYSPRLGRINTDQTLSLLPTTAKSAHEALLPHLRKFADEYS